MANFYGSGRSNYVTVTDVEKFKELCTEFEMEFIEKDGKVGCYSLNEDGDTTIYVEDEEEESGCQERNFINEVYPLLADEEVLVFMNVGSEKMRYLSGQSIAINNKGERESIDIYDIYEKAKTIGKNITLAEY